MHVIETDVSATRPSSASPATTPARRCAPASTSCARPASTADGELLRSTGRHADVATRIATAAADAGASVIVLGRPTATAALSRDVTDLVTREAPASVLVVNPSLALAA